MVSYIRVDVGPSGRLQFLISQFLSGGVILYVKHHIDKTLESPLCRLCGEKGETINHIVSECKMLAQREYKRRHDNIARNIHWELCGELDIDRANKWYKHQPEGVSRKENTKILWDFNIQCDHEI